MIATYKSSPSGLSALLPLVGTLSAFVALASVGFAIGGTAMMVMM